MARRVRAGRLVRAPAPAVGRGYRAAGGSWRAVFFRIRGGIGILFIAISPAVNPGRACVHRANFERPPRHDRVRDAHVVSRLRDERHHRAGAARSAGRPEARPAQDPVGHVRRRGAGRDRLSEVGRHRRRCHGAVPPARRRPGLRSDGADGAGVFAALSARGWAGELRLGRWRPAGGDAVHGSAHGPDRGGNARRHRPEHGRLPGQLRRAAHGTDDPAVAAAEPAAERLFGHRGGHGDEHPAAQPGRALRRDGAVDREPAGDAR